MLKNIKGKLCQQCYLFHEIVKNMKMCLGYYGKLNWLRIGSNVEFGLIVFHY